MPSIGSLLAAHRPGDKRSLQALGVALAGTVKPVDALSDTPEGVWEKAEVTGWEQPGTWQEVRAAADYGVLTPAEYDYLAAAVEAMTQEAP